MKTTNVDNIVILIIVFIVISIFVFTAGYATGEIYMRKNCEIILKDVQLEVTSEIYKLSLEKDCWDRGTVECYKINTVNCYKQ